MVKRNVKDIFLNMWQNKNKIRCEPYFSSLSRWNKVAVYFSLDINVMYLSTVYTHFVYKKTSTGESCQSY